MLQLIVAYRARYAINPFKKNEGNAFLAARTHNRRRWSHVFPKQWIGDKVKSDQAETEKTEKGGRQGQKEGHEGATTRGAATTAAGSSVGADGSGYVILHIKQLED